MSIGVRLMEGWRSLAAGLSWIGETIVCVVLIGL